MFINDMKDLNCGVSPDGKHGGFCAYIHLGWDKNGKRIRPKGHGRTEDEAIANALIAAGIRDITQEGYICMNGEVIVPTPNIYNKVADLLDCPKIKEREIAEEKGE